MARIIGPIKVRGKLDDLVCRDTEFGNIIQRKTGPRREQVLQHKSFDLTRRNAGEFKLASGHATLLRRAMGETLQSVRSSSLNGYVIKLMHRISRLDLHSEYGFRHAAGGDLGLLAGFDFNQTLLLEQALPVCFTHSLDIASGNVRLQLPSFIARKKKVYPPAATHFRIVSCAAVIDFTDDRYSNHTRKSELLPLGKSTPGAICLEHQLAVQPGETLIQVMGIHFYKIVDGQEVLLKGGAMRILEATTMEIARTEDALHELAPTRKTIHSVTPYTIHVLQDVKNLLAKRVRPRKPIAITPPLFSFPFQPG